MQYMRGRVRAADAVATGIANRGRYALAEFQDPFAQLAEVQREAFFFLRVDYFELESGAADFAGVANLAPRFAVERSLIEHHSDRLFVADFLHCFAQMILRDDADNFRRRRSGLVAEKLCRLHC